MTREKGMSIGGWIIFIILAVLLFAVLAGLYPTFIVYAERFRNATGNNSLSVILVVLMPYLFAAAILLLMVYELLPQDLLHGRHK